MDPITKREYERSYVADLERRIHEPEEQRTGPSRNHLSSGLPEAMHHSRFIRTSVDENESQSSFQTASTPSQYVGHSSEINFTKLIIANLQSRTLAAKTPKLTEALMSIHPRRPPAVNTIANDLPSSVIALQLIKSYFIGHHIVSPFLSRKEILNLYMAVYQSHGTTRTTDNGFTNASQSHQNLFRLNMVYTLGSVEMTRKGLHESPPMGYYISATQHFQPVPKIVSLEAAQNLLLVAEFTMLHDTGCSIWDIARICMRTCLLMNLHRENPDLDQHARHRQQMVFWACYSVDRMASMTLGRPFSISDRDISIQPVTAVDDDDTEIVSHILGPSTAAKVPVGNGYFVSQLRLRRLSSEISTYFCRLRRQRSSEEVSTDIRNFLNRIDDWRRTSAQAPRQGVIVYYEADWLDYMAAKERLSMARAAINFVVSGQGKVPKDLRELCLGAGLSIIQAYTTLFQAGEVTPNRMSFYVLFSASVSCLYCLLVEFGPSIGLQSAGFDLCPESSSKAGTLKSLASAVQVLAQAVVHFPDLRGYSAALEVVVSQMQGPRTSMQAGSSQISSHVADAPLPADGDFGYLGNLGIPREFDNSWPVSDSMYGLDWQSIGAEMWQFVEPRWLGSLNENDMLDLQGSPNHFSFN